MFKWNQPFSAARENNTCLELWISYKGQEADNTSSEVPCRSITTGLSKTGTHTERVIWRHSREGGFK